MDVKNYTGKEMRAKGFNVVAKITLWDSQFDDIQQLFSWSEENDFPWQWYETRYDAPASVFSNKEVSFIFFLRDEDHKEFRRNFPANYLHRIVWEPFDGEVFDHYQSNDGVTKRPGTK